MAGPPSRSSFPSGVGDPVSRRLGVGSSTRERPLRAQIVVALVAVCILIAVSASDIKTRGKYLEWTAGAGGLGAAAGPLVVGLVTTAVSWRSTVTILQSMMHS